MSKDLKLDKGVDKHLKPVKDSDGTQTALEVSTDKVRVKDFEIAGNIVGDIKSGDKLNIDANTIIIRHSSPSATTPLLKLINNDSSNYGSWFSFHHNSDSPANSDEIGSISFLANNNTSSGGGELYARIVSQSMDITDGAEEGRVLIQVADGDGGALTAGLSVYGDGGAVITEVGGTLLVTGNFIKTPSIMFLNSVQGIFWFLDDADLDDNFTITVVGGTGATTLATVSAGDDGHLILDADGDLTLDSNSGNFIAKKAGTEFSAANSAYAGMILGCTHVFGSGANGVFQAVTIAWESLLWDTDKYALVTFVVPPSNRVKISVFLPKCILSGFVLQLGLADDNAANSLGTKYENNVWDVDETDTVAINYSWVVEGSDHSWAAGETKTLYIMAYADGATRIYTGGTNTDKYGGVIVEATALPATIGDGSEP